MSDDANNGGGTDEQEAVQAEPVPAPPQLSAEQVRAAMIQNIAMEAAQLLAIVGVSVDPKQLLQAAAAELALQQKYGHEILPLFQNPQAQQYPVIALQLQRGKSSPIVLPGQGMQNAPFAVGGPKRLSQQSHPGDVIGTLTTLQFILNPAWRLVAAALQIQLHIIQTKPPGARPRIKQ